LIRQQENDVKFANTDDNMPQDVEIYTSVYSVKVTMIKKRLDWVNQEMKGFISRGVTGLTTEYSFHFCAHLTLGDLYRNYNRNLRNEVVVFVCL